MALWAVCLFRVSSPFTFFAPGFVMFCVCLWSFSRCISCLWEGPDLCEIENRGDYGSSGTNPDGTGECGAASNTGAAWFLILNIFDYKHFVKKGNVASFCAVCNAIWHWCICVAIELNELYLLHHSLYDVERATLPFGGCPRSCAGRKAINRP